MTFKLRFVLFLPLVLTIIATTHSYSQSKSDIKNRKEGKSGQQIQQEAEYYFTEGEKQYILEDYAKAVNSFRASLQLVPSNDVAYYKLAQIYNTTNQVDAAKLSIEKALELNDKNPYYYLLAADIYTNANNLEEATHYYEKLIKNIPGEEHTLFQLAALYLYLKDYEKALATYQKAEAHFGINEQASVQKQKIYLKQNEVDKAIGEGVRLMEAFPGNPKYAIMLAEVLSSNGKDEQAIQLLLELLEGRPNMAGARLILADLYRKKRNFEGFEKELTEVFSSVSVPASAKINTVTKYMALLPDNRLEALLPTLSDKIVEMHPDDPNGFLLQGDVYSTMIEKQYVPEGKTEAFKYKAVEGYSTYVKFDASKFNVWQNLLNFEVELNETDSSIIHSQQALEVFPNQAWLYLVSGVAHLQNKQPEKAIFYFEEGKKRASNNNQMLELFYGYLGDTYNSTKKFQKSDESYESALLINPNNELVLNNYSYFLSLRGQNLDKAKEMSTKLIRLNSDNLAYLDTYAWVQYKLGYFEEARRVLEKIVEHKEANADNFDHYGDVLFKLGDIKNAKIQWQKAKELDSSIKNIDKKIEQGKIIQ